MDTETDCHAQEETGRGGPDMTSGDPGVKPGLEGLVNLVRAKNEVGVGSRQ